MMLMMVSMLRRGRDVVVVGHGIVRRAAGAGDSLSEALYLKFAARQRDFHNYF